MGTIIGLVVVAVIVVVIYKLMKSSSGNASGLVKQATRIVLNETKSILNKLEDLEKSLSGGLNEAKTNYEKYKTNCGSIFELEAKLSKDLLEQEKSLEFVNNKLIVLKKDYTSSTDDESKKGIEEAISFYLDKQLRIENKIKDLTTMVNDQKDQNLKVEANLLKYKSKIEDLEDKIAYVKNQYNIAKNKEMMNSASGDNGGIYNLDEIFESVNNYVNRVDGMTRVNDVILQEEIKEDAVEKFSVDLEKKDRLKKFLSE